MAICALLTNKVTVKKCVQADLMIVQNQSQRQKNCDGKLIA